MNLSPLPKLAFLGNNGKPLVGGLLFSYAAGTSTPQVTYTDRSGGTPNTNPVVLDFRGEANVWVDINLTYKYVLAPRGDTDPPTKPIWTVDNIAGALTLADLTQQVIGLILYPRTAAEISAGVTPTNYAYPPGYVYRYGTNTTPGTTDMSAAFQSAIDAWAAGGVGVYAPAGSYLVNTTLALAATTTGRNTAGQAFSLRGDGAGVTIIVTSADKETLTTTGDDATHFLFAPHIHDLTFQNTYPVSGSPQLGCQFHHVKLSNALQANIEHVTFKGAFTDVTGNSGNHGGLWLRKNGYTAAYLNVVTDCWFDHAHITIETSDSTITQNIIWGMAMDYCIKVSVGNVAIEGNYDFNGNGAHGAIWLTGSAIFNRVVDNFFDAECKYGIYSDSGFFRDTIVKANCFWHTTSAAIWAKNAYGWTVSGNCFENCGTNAGGDLDSDIVLEATTFSNQNTFSDNVHFRDDAYSSPARAVHEYANGGTLQGNRYIGNQVIDGASGYTSPAISVNQSLFNDGSVLIGNRGEGTETEAYGTFTATLTGCTTSPTGSVRYSRQGNLVSFYFPSIQATSNTTSATLTGVLAALRPANAQFGAGLITDNGANTLQGFAVNADGTITLLNANSTTGFTGSGTKGIFAGTSITYQLT